MNRKQIALKENELYTMGEIEAEVIYKLDGGQFGIEKGYCVMGIKIHTYNF